MKKTLIMTQRFRILPVLVIRTQNQWAMKMKHFFLTLFERCVSLFSINRNGDALDCQKWDDMYDSVLYGRMTRHQPHR